MTEAVALDVHAGRPAMARPAAARSARTAALAALGGPALVVAGLDVRLAVLAALGLFGLVVLGAVARTAWNDAGDRLDAVLDTLPPAVEQDTGAVVR